MKGILCMAGIILLKPVMPAHAVQSDLKSLRGKLHRFPHVDIFSFNFIDRPQKMQ